MIKINKLNKYFNRGSKNELHVLNEIDLDFERTGLVCILGESGSGKTTLLNTLGGLDTFRSGTIQIDDVVLHRYQPSKIEPLRNEKFSYIFQNYFLLQDYTVAYNVKLALSLYNLTEEEKDARVDYVLAQLGLTRYKKKLVSRLSGGQQQRVSIARALVKSPEIILADEPTGNLDEENTLRIMSILKNISKDCLVILVSHERRIAEFFADRIIEIKDGQIVKDAENRVTGYYERGDDANIYLRELEKITLENEAAHFEMYNKPDSVPNQIRLKFAWNHGKLYIQNEMGYDLVLEGEEAGCRMLDEERPQLDMEDVENFSYHLDKLPPKKSATLTHRDILRMAVENISLMGKKQAFVWVIILVTAVLLTITLADYVNAISLDSEQVVQDDSHCAKLTLSNASSEEYEEVTEVLAEIYDEYLAKSPYYDNLFVEPDDDLALMYHGFMQINKLSGGFQNFSYVSAEHLSDEDILYGHKPEKYNEIVVDRLVIEKFLNSDDILASMYHSVDEFLNQPVMVTVFDITLQIAGISDTGEAAVYCGQNVLYSFSTTASKIQSVSDLQAEYPGEYDDMVLAENEVYLTESEKQHIKHEVEKLRGTAFEKRMAADIYETEYEIKGSIPDELGIDYIMNDETCKKLRRHYVLKQRQCQIYMEDPEKDLPVLKKMAQKINTDYGTIIKASVTVPYQQQIQKYKDARKVDLNSKQIFTAIIFLVSLIMIFFTIKSNAASRSEELTVYRLLGIGKGSIIRAYMLEMLMITTCTSLPAVIITSIVLKFISAIPSLEMDMIFPWWSSVLLLAGLYLVNIIISILPVRSILSKPPAKLALKE